MASARSQRSEAPSNRNRSLWTATFLVLLIAITATGLYRVDAAHEMRGLYGGMAEVQREQDGLLEEHSRLMLERGALSSLQNIEQIAATELGMQFPDEVGQVLE